MTRSFENFPFAIEFSDWTGRAYTLGKGEPHWYQEPLRIHIMTALAAKEILSLNGIRFLERFLDGEAEIDGNIYLLNLTRKYLALNLSWLQYLGARLKHSKFQTLCRAKVNVKSHYDIPQSILDVYLDSVYKSYSCAFFQDPRFAGVEEVTTEGKGEGDTFDSLEKAQWRKFKDAIDFIEPAESDSILDIGCGYGGQLVVALESGSARRIVGWTLSENQVRIGKGMLSRFDPARWEINEGDYREDNRVYDHITSTGMVSHVGPRGLAPYVRNIRKRIKSGGRYVHYSLMDIDSDTALDAQVGAAYNKRYIWPGFHWFTLSEHIRALEQNGFRITRLTDCSPHYTKTLVAWYERFMANQEYLSEAMGVHTFRAWRIYLGGSAGSVDVGMFRVCRLYCQAI